MRGRGAAGAALLVVVVGLVAGCSQFAVLQPVAGDGVTAVNNATSDVLAREGVEVMTWPVCEFNDETYTCTGQTVSGQPILARTSATEPMDLTVTVDGRTVFRGTVDSVLEEAGRVP